MFIEFINACAHVQQGRFVCVCVLCLLKSKLLISVCVCVSTVFLGNRGNSEREMWTYYQVGGMHGKLRFWSGEGWEAEVSVRQIEIVDDHCT